MKRACLLMLIDLHRNRSLLSSSSLALNKCSPGSFFKEAPAFLYPRGDLGQMSGGCVVGCCGQTAQHY
jgi:hypothetical protein